MRLMILIFVGVIFSQTVAKVNGSPITIEDLKSVSKMEMNYEVFKNHMLKQNLDRAIERELVYVSAKEKGYSIDSDKEAQQRLDAFKKSLLIDMFIEKEIKPTIPVSEEEIQNEYRFSSDYYKPRRYLTAIVKKSNDEIDLNQAKQVLSAIEIEEDNPNQVYEQVFKKFEESGPRFHVDILELREDDYMLKEFPKIAESQKGSVVGPIVEKENQIVFMLINTLPDESVPLENVRDKLEDRIRNRKLEEGIREYVKEAKSKSKITIDNSVLAE